MATYIPNKIVRGSLVSAVTLGAVDGLLHQALRITDNSEDEQLTQLLSVTERQIEKAIGYMGNYEWVLTFPAGNGRYLLTIPTVKPSTLPSEWNRGTGFYYFMDGEFNEPFSIMVENEFTLNDINVLKVIQRSMISTMYRNPDYASTQSITINSVNASSLNQFKVDF